MIVIEWIIQKEYDLVLLAIIFFLLCAMLLYGGVKQFYRGIKENSDEKVINSFYSFGLFLYLILFIKSALVYL